MGGIRPFKSIPADLVEWARFFTSTQVEPSPGTITDETFAQRDANSIIGRPQGTVGAPSDIPIGANQFLTNRAGTVQADGLLDSDIPSGIARDTEVSAAAAAAQAAAEATAAAALAAHVADSDPHPVYLTQAEGDAAYVLQSNTLNGSKTYDPASLIDGSEVSTTVTVTGAALGDFALASFSLSTQGIKLTAEVTASDTVTVNFHNKTGGTIDLASGTLKARVFK